MAYQIEYSESIWSGRSRKKAVLRLLLLAAVGGTAYGVYDVYKTYNKPTLNMKLAEYEAVTRPIEEINKVWDETVKEYNAMLRYYRLVWAANPTNFLSAMVSTNAPRLARGFHPTGWTLKTGGECRLDYNYVFNLGDKAEQAKELKAALGNAVTSVVKVVDDKVDIQGVQEENLLNVNELNISARFSLPNVKNFPEKERTLADCVKEIASMRKKVQETRFMEAGDAKGDPTTALALMTMPYIGIGKDAEGRPNHKDAIDIMGWLRSADKFIESAAAKTGKPVPDADTKRRQRLKDIWNRIGEARFPWSLPWGLNGRFRALDNDELVDRTKALGTVSDGVKRFKGFLDQRHDDCRKKLEPFIEAYSHNDVFNKPFIESDLRDRVAKAAGISRVRVEFNDEPNVEPAVLVKDDETFTFTWVRWRLFIGEVTDRDGKVGNGESGVRSSSDAPASDGPLTLERLTDCARRALELGPGYALDVVRVVFGGGGGINGAVMEGLLPVKKVDSTKKEAVENGD